MPADDWVERARRLFPGLDATQHVLVNAWLQPDRDAVRVRTSMRADHFLGRARYTLGGQYMHRLVPADGGWLIGAVTLTVTWEEGDEGILVRAAEAVAAR